MLFPAEFKSVRKGETGCQRCRRCLLLAGTAKQIGASRFKFFPGDHVPLHRARAAEEVQACAFVTVLIPIHLRRLLSASQGRNVMPAHMRRLP